MPQDPYPLHPQRLAGEQIGLMRSLLNNSSFSCKLTVTIVTETTTHRYPIDQIRRRGPDEITLVVFRGEEL